MKIITVLTAFILFPLLLKGQTSTQAANQAYMITRMVSKFHVEPRALDETFSAHVFTGMFARTDADRLFFTQSDIAKLSQYRTKLHSEIKLRKTAYLDLFIRIYQQRLQQADSLLNEMAKKPLNFYLAEKLTVAEDTLYPVSTLAMQQKLTKKVKMTVLDDLAEGLPGRYKTYTPDKQKHYTDSALAVLQKKTISAFKRKIGRVLQNPMGIIKYTGNIYCSTIASCYDPHTEFFPPDEKENFESELGKQPFKFGFTMRADKNGGALIENLQPGSPAYKSGKLKKGDKFISLQWEGRPPVDVSDVNLHEMGSLIDESNHQKVIFTVKKADGTVVTVPLQKELALTDEEGKVKSFILKGPDATIGYIYLPAFYGDWTSRNDGLNGCANDVGREILKLKKENINGLILDVRFNGGGSVQEATELAGIFIDAGPVAQVKTREVKTTTLYDTNRGTLYDGPLVIMVNGYSASAAELFAGTLQDYNRAVIVGSPTYGKATMQVVLPIDTSVTPENIFKTKSENYLKVTVGKLYRVNGNTAQFKGVQPDILLPDILDAYVTKEADEPNSLAPTIIPANKYYTPYTYLPIKTLAQGEQPKIDSNRYFNEVKKIITYARQKKVPKDTPISVKDAVAAVDENAKFDKSLLISGSVSKKFAVLNNAYDLTRLQTNTDLKELNQEFVAQLASDACIHIAYDVLLKLKP
jgi:carboxyl-terminal processing protease